MHRALLPFLVTCIGLTSLPVGYLNAEKRVIWSEAHALSVEKEKELGKKVVEEIERRMEIIRVPWIQTYVEKVGRKLLAHADRSELPIRFSVLNESQPNAFAIPGGDIFLTSGLIRLVENEGELAGVMSHEVAHVVRRHVARRIEESQRINIATLAGVLAGALVGGSEGGAVIAGSLAMGESQKLKYTRENESEADRLALAYMNRAGYDQRYLVSFFKKIARTPEYDATFPSYLSTHPGIPERISYLEALEGGLPASASMERASDDLRSVQIRLFIIENGALEALEYFDRLLKTKPDDADALFGRALAEKEMGRIRQSTEDLKRAHMLKPMDPQILKELGLAFIRSDRINEGVRALERSLSLWENDAETHYYLGQAYQAQKKVNRALESYLNARRLNPDLPELNRHLGSVYKEKGDLGRSHLYYALHFKNKGESQYAQFHLEQARELTGQDAEAQKELQRELDKLKQ